MKNNMAMRRSVITCTGSEFKGYQSPCFHPIAGQTVTEEIWERARVQEMGSRVRKPKNKVARKKAEDEVVAFANNLEGEPVNLSGIELED